MKDIGSASVLSIIKEYTIISRDQESINEVKNKAKFYTNLYKLR